MTNGRDTPEPKPYTDEEVAKLHDMRDRGLFVNSYERRMLATIDALRAEAEQQKCIADTLRTVGENAAGRVDGECLCDFIAEGPCAMCKDFLRIRELEKAGKALTEAHSAVDAGCDSPADFFYDEAWHHFWQVLYGQTEDEAEVAEMERQQQKLQDIRAAK